jgi:AcrR family transcriptional regulator
VIPLALGEPGELTHLRIAAYIDELATQVAEYRHGKVPADLRRAHILAIAFGLFAQRPFADVSMDEIARLAGVSKPVVYTLLGDKEGIFRTCADLATLSLGERVSTAMRAAPEPEACLRAGARAFFEFVADAGPGWDRLVSSQAGPVGVELALARRRQTEVVAELLGELFARERARSGDVVSDEAADRLQIDAIAHSMNGACERLAEWWRQHPEVDLEVLVELATRLVAPGVMGVIAQPPDGWTAGESEQTGGTA